MSSENRALATYDSSDGVDGDAALLEATLVVADDCISLETHDGKEALPVFPSTEVSFDDGTEVLTLYGAEYRDGDPIAVSGSMTTDASSVTRPGGCLMREMWLVGGEVTG